MELLVGSVVVDAFWVALGCEEIFGSVGLPLAFWLGACGRRMVGWNLRVAEPSGGC